MNLVIDKTPQGHTFADRTSATLPQSFLPATDAYFVTPRYRLVVKPPFVALLPGNNDNIATSVENSLLFTRELGHENAIVIGAIPFDQDERAHLTLSTNSIFCIKAPKAAHSPSTDTAKMTSTNPLSQSRVSIVSDPDKRIFKSNVVNAIARMKTSQLRKVVLSRTLQLTSDSSIAIGPIIDYLETRNPHGFTFSINFKDREKRNKTLVGASPELLISVHDGKVIAHPMAGSEPRSGNEKLDQSLREQLLASKKDRYEHKLVVDQVAKQLTYFCRDLVVPETPAVIETPTMLHLATEIRGELRDRNLSSLNLALALHPTPAVCGYPTHAARQTIGDLEHHQRGLFCGIVGWCDTQGNGEWVVTIRCATIANNQATLFAGAGIVEGSCPEKEWRETGAKFNTMLNAFGVNNDECR